MLNFDYVFSCCYFNIPKKKNFICYFVSTETNKKENSLEN